MIRGKNLVIVGVAMMVLGAFEMGRALGHRPKTVVMDEVLVTPTPDAGAFDTLAKPVTVDAGAPPSVKFDPTDRRGEFAARMDILATNIGIKYSDKVSVEKIYFAVTNTEKADAAFVLLKAEKMKETTGLLFLFSNDDWKTFPSDFQ
jgi:hypothetical protein